MRAVVLSGSILFAASALAEEALPAPPAAAAAETVAAAPVAPAAGGWEARNHWENGLDAKLMDFYERDAADVTSPTVVLAAQWSYKFSWSTYLGLTAGGMPQTVKREDEDTGAKISYAMYYGGLYLAQGLLEMEPFRVVFSVTGARGLLYARVKVPTEDAEAVSRKFDLVEPGLFVTFYRYKGVELGATASYRSVKLAKEDAAFGKDDDLSSAAFGLTFRTQRY